MADSKTPVRRSGTEPRGADRLAGAMDAAGISVVFSLSGNQIMPLYDAFIDTSTRVVHTRHEAAAVFMAEGHARVSGQPGVALVTAAPGFGNALGALYSSTMSEVPLLLLSGDSPVSNDGQGAFQELDQAAAAAPIVKASLRLTRDEDPAEVFAEAVRIACSATPGPVHLALPYDVLSEPAIGGPLPGSQAFAPARIEPDADDVARIGELLASSQRPVVLAGPHLLRAGNAGKEALLADALDAPIITLESPRGLRDPAKGALPAILAAADCVLYLGKPVDFTSGFGAANVVPAERVAVVSADDESLSRAATAFGERLELAVKADAVAVADALIARARESSSAADHGGWREEAAAALAHRNMVHTTDADLHSKGVIEAVARQAADDPETILICDGGEFGQWALAFASAGTRLANGPSGAIGGSLPYAIGAKIARPDAPVIAVMGDGTAGFHLAEFETASREGVAITVVIGNDSRWNAEHLIQVRDYGPERLLGCELGSTVRYDVAATGLGCDGILAQTLPQVDDALKAAARSGRPTCINAIIPGAPAPVYTGIDLGIAR